MHDPFSLVWLTSTLIIVPAAWAAIFVGFVRCFRFDVNEQQSTSKPLTETHTWVERTRLLVLSRPIMEKFSSSSDFETHFIQAIERLQTARATSRSFGSGEIDTGWCLLVASTACMRSSLILDFTIYPRTPG